MVHALAEVGCVSDAELVRRLECLVKADRTLAVKLLVHLGELDARKLYLERGYSSIYEYCKTALRMSGDEAYFRVRAAKVGRQFPLILEKLGAGAVHLTGINLLAPYFTDENHARLLERAEGKTKKQIEVLVAELAPRSDVPARLRRLPTKTAASLTQSSMLALSSAQSVSPLPPTAAMAANPSVLTTSETAVVAAVSVPFALQSPPARAFTRPLSPGRFKLEVTLGEDAHSKLEQLQELLRHQDPTGDLAKIVERALSELLERELKRRFAQTSTPKRRVAREPARSASDANAAMQRADPETDRSGPTANAPSVESRGSGTAEERPPSRYIPRAVVREVFARDGGQCTFVSAEGRRCSARGFLELHHHETTFAHGGEATPDNIRLACRAHNFFLAEREYGREFMQQKLMAAVANRVGSEPLGTMQRT